MVRMANASIKMVRANDYWVLYLGDTDDGLICHRYNTVRVTRLGALSKKPKG